MAKVGQLGPKVVSYLVLRAAFIYRHIRLLFFVLKL